MGGGTSGTQVQCQCSHLTAFAASFVVPVNTIDFDSVFEDVSAKLAQNFAILATLLGFLLLYYILVLILRHLDLKDQETVGPFLLCIDWLLIRPMSL